MPSDPPAPAPVAPSPGVSASHYVSIQGQTYGPYTTAQLAELAWKGTISPETPWCLAGSETWTKAAAAPGIAFQPRGAPTSNAPPEDIKTNVKQGALIGGFVCLVLGLVLEFASLMTFILYGPIFLAAFLLSIVAMAQRRVIGGVVLLLLTLIVPPVFGLALMAVRVPKALEASKTRAQEQPKAVEQSTKPPSTESKPGNTDDTVAAENAARAFPEQRSALLAEVASLRTLISAKKWPEAKAASASLEQELAPLRKSGIGSSPDVADLTIRFESARSAIAAYDAAEEAKLAEYNNADASRDIRVLHSSWAKGGFDTVAIWKVTLRNNNKYAAFADIAYRASYAGASGTTLDTKTGVIYEILRPGQTRTFQVNDGFVHGQVSQASFVFVGAAKKAP